MLRVKRGLFLRRRDHLIADFEDPWESKRFVSMKISGKGLRELFELFWECKKRVTKARSAFGGFPQKLKQ